MSTAPRPSWRSHGRIVPSRRRLSVGKRVRLQSEPPARATTSDQHWSCSSAADRAVWISARRMSALARVTRTLVFRATRAAVLASVETLERGVAGRDHPKRSYPLARHTRDGRDRPHLRVRPSELLADRPVVRLDGRKTFDVSHGLVLTAGVADLGLRCRHRPRRRHHALSAARAWLVHIAYKRIRPW